MEATTLGFNKAAESRKQEISPPAGNAKPVNVCLRLEGMFYSPSEPQSKLLESPSLTPTVVPQIIPYIAHFPGV